MLVYVAREWAKVSVKEISRRLHRDPSIISRLYAAYALARRRPDFSTVSYFTPRATLSTVGRVEFSKTHSCHRYANRFQGGRQTGEIGLGPGRKTSRITSSGLPDASGFKRASTPRARDGRLVSQGSVYVGCSKMYIPRQWCPACLVCMG
jgi:hypothetical protein